MTTIQRESVEVQLQRIITTNTKVLYMAAVQVCIFSARAKYIIIFNDRSIAKLWITVSNFIAHSYPRCNLLQIYLHYICGLYINIIYSDVRAVQSLRVAAVQLVAAKRD